MAEKIRIGHGFDIHRLIEQENSFILLGGVKIASNKKVVSHSDGDVLFHSLSEAILLALGLSDIGTYFPDTINSTKNMDSKEILIFSLNKMKEMNFKINNVTISIVLERPKLKDYVKTIKDNLSKLLDIDSSCIGISCNTNEKLDSLGQNKGVYVDSTVLLISY